MDSVKNMRNRLRKLLENSGVMQLRRSWLGFGFGLGLLEICWEVLGECKQQPATFKLPLKETN